MRAFLFFILAVASHAAPQGGYNYQIQFDSGSRNDLSQSQFELLQQYAHQQLNQQHDVAPQPSQFNTNSINTPQVSVVSQTVTQGNEAAGYHFANQLVQHAQLAQHEHEQRKQQLPPEQAQTSPAQSVHAQEPAAVVENTPSQVYEAPKQEQPQINTESLVQFQSPPQEQEARHPIIPQQRRKSVQYNKEFFYLSAPQEDFDQTRDLNDDLDNLRKNIRVVFIRAPENNHLADAALKLAKQSLDQQTIVYVLTKQHDSSELANKLHQIRAGSHSKPDVIFIKYKTPEEAEHAQRTIQAQYETLDGPNHFNHEGVAPTHSFVGFTSGHHSGSVRIDPRKSSSSGSEQAPSTKYLPAASKL